MSTPSPLDLGAGHLRAGVARDALLAERLLELGRHRLVLDRHEPRQQLEDRHVAAEAAEDRRELDADRAAAHDRDRLRAPLAGRIASSLVMMRLRSISMPGTLRGVEPVATMISLRARSVCVSPSKTSTPPLPVSRAVPLIQSILFFLNRNSTPLVRPRDDPVLARCTCAMSMRDRRRPDRRRSERDAPFLRVLDDLQRVRVLEQRLGRNAAPQQARAAERLLLLDDGDLQPSCAARIAAT